MLPGDALSASLKPVEMPVWCGFAAPGNAVWGAGVSAVISPAIRPGCSRRRPSPSTDGCDQPLRSGASAQLPPCSASRNSASRKSPRPACPSRARLVARMPPAHPPVHHRTPLFHGHTRRNASNAAGGHEPPRVAALVSAVVTRRAVGTRSRSPEPPPVRPSTSSLQAPRPLPARCGSP